MLDAKTKTFLMLFSFRYSKLDEFFFRGFTEIETQFVNEKRHNDIYSATSSSGCFSFVIFTETKNQSRIVNFDGIFFVCHMHHGKRREREQGSFSLPDALRLIGNSTLNHRRVMTHRHKRYVFTSSRCVKAKVNEFYYLWGVTRKKCHARRAQKRVCD
jgi:hypothetical protein